MLIRHLPPDSAFAKAAAPDVAAIAAWSATTYAVADLFDLTAAVAGAKASGRPLPPYPRPRDAIAQRQRDEARSAALIAQRKRLEARQAERRGAQET